MKNDFYNTEQELLNRKELTAYQIHHINNLLERVQKSSYYKKILSKFKLNKINSLEDFTSFPFTTKSDLRDNFPYGFLSKRMADVVRIHSSSGTTGNPIVVFNDKKDICDWANIVARCMYMTGARKNDVFQNTMGYGLFTGGLGFHYGAEKLGMLTIPHGPGNSQRQIWFMQQFKTTALHILPSYALHLFQYIKELKLKSEDLSLKMAFIGAEPHSEDLRKQIQNLYNIKAFNSYGLSEMCGPGVAF